MTEERALTVAEKIAEKIKACDLRNPKHVAWVMSTSGLFNDIKDMTQALVKVQAGRELGLGAFAAMQAFDIVEGKLRIGSGQLASWVKASEKYDYRVREHTAQGCRIEWLQREPGGEWESIGFSSWTDEDRERAGLSLKTRSGAASVWGKYPVAMMFNRALSNGVAMFCPDVVPTGNRVYTPGDDFGPRDAGYHERMEIEIEAEGAEVTTPSEEGDGEHPDQPSPSSKMSTDAQRKKIMAMCRERGLNDDDRHARMKSKYGVESVNDLTREQAGDMIERLAVIPKQTGPELPDEED